MRRFFLVCTALAAAACGSSSNGERPEFADASPALDGSGEAPEASSTPRDASGPSADGGSAVPIDTGSDAPRACNTLSNTGPIVTTQQVAMDPPQLQGGTVADGTYTLVDATIYTGPSGPTGAGGSAQTTLQITGSTIQVASTGDPTTRTVTLVTMGASFTASDTCPDNAILQGTYSATPTMFAIAIAGGTDDAGARTVVETFAKN